MFENQREKRKSEKYSGPFKEFFSRFPLGFLLFTAVFAVYLATLSILYGPGNLTLATGCHWDCGWYSSIVRNGYVSTLPPTAQDVNHSNVAFFPLFPILGSFIGRLFSLSPERALPLVSIFFAFGICCLLPRRRALLLVAYPATFYFFVAYSESVYCFFLFAGLTLLLRRRKIQPGFLYPAILVVGLALGLTRLTGFVIPGAVLGVSLLGLLTGRSETDRKLLTASGFWTIGAILGAAAFFLYSAVKFGEWNLYFQTLNLGWHKEATLVGFLRYFPRALLKNVFPPWFARDPTRMSWIVTADTIVVLGAVLFVEGRTFAREARAKITAKVDADRLLRFALLAGGFVHLLITTIGDSGEYHRWGNGMRYTMPVFYLLVFLWDDDWTPKWARKLYYPLLAFWIPFQLYYLYLFTQTIWVS